MASTNTIPVGLNSHSKYVAFGDDCQFNDIYGYAYIVVKRSRIPWIIRELEAIKTLFSFPTEVTLHCRVMFSGDQRRKAGLSHLTREGIESIVIRCLLLLNNAGVHVRFSSGSLQEFKDTMGNTLTMWDHVNATKLHAPLHHDPKGLISLLSQMCLMVPAPDRRFARSEEWEIVVSKDTTPAKLIGKGSRQAHHLMNGFSSIGAPEGQVFQFTPRISTEATHPLLQLADVAVYALCHALDGSEKAAFWRSQLPSLRQLHHIPYKPIKPHI